MLYKSGHVCFSSGAASALSPSSDAPVLLVPVPVAPALDRVQGRVLGGQRAPVPEAGGQGAGGRGPRGAPGKRGQVGAPPPAQVTARPRLLVRLRPLCPLGACVLRA